MMQPVAEAIMPKLPRGPLAWREAIKQWEEVDPQTGFALKDWPHSWYGEDMRLFNGTKYSERKMLAQEYIDK